ncbi:MAG: nicotinamide riboside transporter PnuC [Nonlabens sp.]
MDWLLGLFSQYSEYSTLHIILELVAVAASVVSVFYSKANDIRVFSYGIVGTLIFTYLLYEWNLLGDMVINLYYFVMSVYGWWLWSTTSGRSQKKVTNTLSKEWIIAGVIGMASAVAIYLLYQATDRLESWPSYIDMITTGLFFAGMWLMVLRKLEHWLVLMVGNLISIPLYFYKGLSFSALLYLFLAIIAFIGYREWKRYHLNQGLPENG